MGRKKDTQRSNRSERSQRYRDRDRHRNYDDFSETSSEDEEEYYIPEETCEPEFYSETINTIDPLQEDYSRYLYMQTPLGIDRIRQHISNAKKLQPKIQWYICRLSHDNKYFVLVKFTEEVDENELAEIKNEFRNTDSYAYFPKPRFDLILDYMNTHASAESNFIIEGDCKLDIESILIYKKTIRDLIENNINCGIYTTDDTIRDKVIRTFIDRSKMNATEINIQEFIDKFGYYGLKMLNKLNLGRNVDKEAVQ